MVEEVWLSVVEEEREREAYSLFILSLASEFFDPEGRLVLFVCIEGRIEGRLVLFIRIEGPVRLARGKVARIRVKVVNNSDREVDINSDNEVGLKSENERESSASCLRCLYPCQCGPLLTPCQIPRPTSGGIPPSPEPGFSFQNVSTRLREENLLKIGR